MGTGEAVNTVEKMLLLGGHPAIDFVNTLGGARTGPLPEDEHIRSYGDLLTFAGRAGTLSEAAAKDLRREARLRPADAEVALEAAFDLRRLVEHALRPLAEGERPRDSVLRALRKANEVALRNAELERADKGYEWSWGASTRELEAPLWPLAHATIELLTSERLARLKACRRCRWLFLDLSKNRSRRWCSMDACGTDAKKERYVERRRAARRPAGRRAPARRAG